MPILNIEIKAGTKKQTHIREALGLLKATFKGIIKRIPTLMFIQAD